jgi:hypothetical protein
MSEHTPHSSLTSLPRLIATSVVRGARQGQSHGGVYLIDFARREARQVVDWNSGDIDFAGRGWDRGLRGIAFYGEEVYIAASDELFVYDRRFRIQRSFRCRYLKHCHEISAREGRLFLTSTGFDSLLLFDLQAQRFSWALHVSATASGWLARAYDPHGSDGPPPQNLLHLNNVHAGDSGLYLSGMRTRALLRLGADNRLDSWCSLPEGVHNARPFRDGVLFNDTAADHLRFVRRDGAQVALRTPHYDPAELEHAGVDDSKVARQGFGRGLCPIDDRRVAAGSSPSTVTIYDLDRRARIASVNLTMDIRNAIHGLEVWPWD